MRGKVGENYLDGLSAESPLGVWEAEPRWMDPGLQGENLKGELTVDFKVSEAGMTDWLE